MALEPPRMPPADRGSPKKSRFVDSVSLPNILGVGERAGAKAKAEKRVGSRIGGGGVGSFPWP